MKNRFDESENRGNETSKRTTVIIPAKPLRTCTKKCRKVERFKKHLEAGIAGLGEGLDEKDEGIGLEEPG